MTSWTLTFTELTPSNREYSRMHRMTQHKLRTRWQWMVNAQRNAITPPIPKAQGLRRVTIVRHSSGTLDRDNLWGGVKPLLDALTGAGLIVDDKPASCDLHVEQARVYFAGIPRMVVTLEEVG